jgi:hypothetical protein
VSVTGSGCSTIAAWLATIPPTTVAGRPGNNPVPASAASTSTGAERVRPGQVPGDDAGAGVAGQRPHPDGRNTGQLRDDLSTDPSGGPGHQYRPPVRHADHGTSSSALQGKAY